MGLVGGEKLSKEKSGDPTLRALPRQRRRFVEGLGDWVGMERQRGGGRRWIWKRAGVVTAELEWPAVRVKGSVRMRLGKFFIILHLCAPCLQLHSIFQLYLLPSFCGPTRKE